MPAEVRHRADNERDAQRDARDDARPAGEAAGAGVGVRGPARSVLTSPGGSFQVTMESASRVPLVVFTRAGKATLNWTSLPSGKQYDESKQTCT